MANTNKLQPILDQMQEAIANGKKGRINKYFKETLHGNASNRAQTSSEIMLIDDVILDPLHLETWESMVQGLLFSSEFKHQAKVEFFLLSQMKIEFDLTLQAPAAVTMFKNDVILKTSSTEKVKEIYKAQQDDTSYSQSGYLLINPLCFWNILEKSLPRSYKMSVNNEDFKNTVKRQITELMLHEVNHHINGHTLLINTKLSPLDKTKEAQYQKHHFQLGEFQIGTSATYLANIIEDYAINEYIAKTYSWPNKTYSLFNIGVADINKSLFKTKHSLKKQQVSADDLKDIDKSILERIQLYTNSDILIDDPKKESKNNKQQSSGSSDSEQQSDQNQENANQDDNQSKQSGNESNETEDGSKSELSEIVDELQKSVQPHDDADTHASNQQQSQVEQELAEASLSKQLEDAEDTTGQRPGMQGADYNRTLKLTDHVKKLPQMSLKLAQVRRKFRDSSHVNWSMPHQVLCDRLDLHRIEKKPAEPEINVWIDTSGSMSEKEISLLMSLIVQNYVTNANKTPIMLHTVSFGEVNNPVCLRSTRDVEHMKKLGLGSNGGTDFESVLATLESGKHIIMSDFEWNDTDISNNMKTLSDKDKKILWINTSGSSNNNVSSITKLIRRLPNSIHIFAKDYQL